MYRGMRQKKGIRTLNGEVCTLIWLFFFVFYKDKFEELHYLFACRNVSQRFAQSFAMFTSVAIARHCV